MILYMEASAREQSSLYNGIIINKPYRYRRIVLYSDVILDISIEGARRYYYYIIMYRIWP